MRAGKKIGGPTLLLQSGNYFDLLDPENSVFTIEDVAQGLAKTSRFGGQNPGARFYSVAQHSVHVSEEVERTAPEAAFAALLHDAVEFITGDIRKPMKEILLGFWRVERRFEGVILSRFGVRLPLHPAIKEADLRLVATEQRQIMNNGDDWETTKGRRPLEIILPDWDVAEAKRRFLARFEELSGRAAA